MKLKRTISFMLVLILSASMCATNVFAAATLDEESVTPTEETAEVSEDSSDTESVVPTEETVGAPEASSNAESEAATEETVGVPEDSDTESIASTVETTELSEDVIYDTENGKTIGISPNFELKSETPSGVFGTGEKINDVLRLGQIATLEESNKVIVKLPNAGDVKTFNMQIDHSLYPEAKLCAFISGGLGDCSVDVSGVRMYTLTTKTTSISTGFSVKEIFNINGSGGVKDYTVTVSSTTGNIGCTLILATEDTLAEMCGGQENTASIQKNESIEHGVTWFGGIRSLLKGEGEWFRYTADGDTYIHAYATAVDDLIVSVYDAVTGIIFAQTEEKDREIERDSGTSWTGHVSKKFELQAGHEYLIQVQSSSATTANGTRYGLSVGLPSTIFDMIEVTSNNTFSIPANTTKTFTFKVSGYPNSTRLSSYGRICFQTDSVISDLDITSCKFTAPNGKVFFAPSQGEYDLSQPIDHNNYFTNPNNVPLNGTWTVTIRSKKALSGLKFKIKAEVQHIPGSDGNE